jgi:hypothetical protein
MVKLVAEKCTTFTVLLWILIAAMGNPQLVVLWFAATKLM